jgi:hypothetical protein
MSLLVFSNHLHFSRTTTTTHTFALYYFLSLYRMILNFTNQINAVCSGVCCTFMQIFLKLFTTFCSSLIILFSTERSDGKN